MKRFVLIGIFVLLIASVLTGCYDVSGEPFQLPAAVEETEDGLNEMQTCMFVLWYFTEPTAPTLENAIEMCEDIMDYASDPKHEFLWSEINEALDIEIIPVCAGNCT